MTVIKLTTTLAKYESSKVMKVYKSFNAPIPQALSWLHVWEVTRTTMHYRLIKELQRSNKESQQRERIAMYIRELQREIILNRDGIGRELPR